MLRLEFSGQFKRDFKRAMKRGCSSEKFEAVVEMLCRREPLPEKYRDHVLTDSREYKDARECYIEPDWLLVYQVLDDAVILRLLRTGSHSDLFK